MDTLTDPEATRVVWRHGGYGTDADYPGIVTAVLAMLIATTRKGQRKLWQALTERLSWGGRDQITDLVTWLRSLLLAIRAQEHTPELLHHDAPPGRTRDITTTETPSRGPNVPAGALAGGCARGRAPT